LALNGVGGQRHASAALPPVKTRYPMYQNLGEPQGRSGQVRKPRLHRDSITGPSMIVPKVSKIYNFLQSEIKTLRASKPVTGNNINNCLSLLPIKQSGYGPSHAPCRSVGTRRFFPWAKRSGGEASDPPQSNTRIKNQRELYLCASCMHS